MARGGEGARPTLSRLHLLAQRIQAATLDFLHRWPAFPAASATLASIYSSTGVDGPTAGY